MADVPVITLFSSSSSEDEDEENVKNMLVEHNEMGPPPSPSPDPFALPPMAGMIWDNYESQKMSKDDTLDQSYTAGSAVRAKSSMGEVVDLTLPSEDSEVEILPTPVEHLTDKGTRSSKSPSTSPATRTLAKNAVISSSGMTLKRGSQKYENAKKKKILILEKSLNKAMEEISRLGEKDVDWDDDEGVNTSYMQQDKLTKSWMKQYNLLCEVTNSSTNTDRAVQMGIRLNNVTNFPNLDKTIQKYVNQKPFNMPADFPEIFKVVRNYNTNFKMGWKAEDAEKLARKLHVKVVRRRQRCCSLDSRLLIPDAMKKDDPAVKSPELEAKLLENARKGQSLQNVARHHMEVELEDSEQSEHSDSDLDDNDESVQPQHLLQ